MNEETVNNEHGQNLLIFAVIMVILIALAGLVIDGGFSMSKRREAQNAADAGALAGAAELCAGNVDQAIPRAIEYVDKNDANASPEDVTLAEKTISVKATIPYDTFLAGIFGTEVVTVTANASAGCYVPCQIEGVLPVAWACQPPEGEDLGDNECGIQYGTDDDPTNRYIIMDSQNLNQDFYCQDPATHLPAELLDCDLDNDGVNDLLAGGNRSWLDLNGEGGGAADLKDWIWNGYGEPLKDHTWFGGQSGVENSVFQAVGDITGSIVWLPVFDSYCEGVPNINCPTSYHAQDIMMISGGTSQTYFHVISFSAFRITCVVAPGVPSNCAHPGRDAAEAINTQLNWNSIKTIEGYFIEDYGGTGKCEGQNTGVYTIYLDN